MTLTFVLSLFSILRPFVLAIPVLHNPLKSQLVPSNPALSSIYFPLPSSVLLKNISHLNPLPSIRVPPNWSFSIGLSGDTFLPGDSEGDSSGNLNLSVQLEDGNPVPHWLQFDPALMTLNGVTPSEVQLNTIMVTASASKAMASDSFILITSPHDLAIVDSFKVRNITTGFPFSLVIDDFERLILDDSPVNVSLFSHNTLTSSVNFSLLLNTSALPWMSWDFTTFSLSGTGPPSSGHYTLPVIASASFSSQHLNLSTSLTLNVFSSYFNTSWLPPQHIIPGSPFGIDLNAFTSTAARRDPQWILSLNDNSSVPWIVLDPARLSLNGTIPPDINSNARVVVLARHMDHNVTNAISFDLVIDDAQNNEARGKPLSHIMSTRILRRVLGACLAGIGTVIVVLVIALIYSRRRRKPKESFKAIGVAYSYREPAIYKTHSRNPIQRVFDNFSLTSSPSLGSRIPTTKAVFDAIRNRLRGERYLDPNLGRSQDRSSPSKQGDKLVTCTTHPRRPRKSKIGRPIAVLNGSSGLFSGLITNLPQTVSFHQQPQKEASSIRIHDRSVAQPPTLFPSSRFSKSYPQFTAPSNRCSENIPRPPNPVLRSASDMSLNDVIPAVSPRHTSASPSMKAGDFLANKRKATSRNAASLGMVKLPSVDPSLHSRPSMQPSLSNENSAKLALTPVARVVRPHFGDSSLEDIGQMEAEGAMRGLDFNGFLKRSVSITRDRPVHSTRTKGNVSPCSPDPSTEEYFGSASNESVIAMSQVRKISAGHAQKSSNMQSVAMTVPSVYSDDQHHTSFPLSSYSIAARQPFAFTPNIPKINAGRGIFFIAKQHNGAELPPWLRFDKATNEFWGVTPDVKKGNVVNVEIDIWNPKTNNVIAGTDVEILG